MNVITKVKVPQQHKHSRTLLDNINKIEIKRNQNICSEFQEKLVLFCHSVGCMLFKYQIQFICNKVSNLKVNTLNDG